MTHAVSQRGRPWRTPPKCPCCGWRARKWVNAQDGAGYYLDWCGDCTAAVESLARRQGMPPLRFGAQPPAGDR